MGTVAEPPGKDKVVLRYSVTGGTVKRRQGTDRKLLDLLTLAVSPLASRPA